MNDNPVATYCKRCEYPLIGLPRPVCPECGTPFDLNDPTTFVVELRARRRKRWLKRGAVALTVLLVLFAVAPRRILKGTINFTCSNCGESLTVKRWEPVAPSWVPLRLPGLTRSTLEGGETLKARRDGRTCPPHSFCVSMNVDLHAGGTMGSKSYHCAPDSRTYVGGTQVRPDTASKVLRAIMTRRN